MCGTYIENYERNLIKRATQEAVDKAKKDLAMKMKADGVSSDFIFKYFGLIL